MRFINSRCRQRKIRTLKTAGCGTLPPNRRALVQSEIPFIGLRASGALVQLLQAFDGGGVALFGGH